MANTNPTIMSRQGMAQKRKVGVNIKKKGKNVADMS